MRLTSPYWKNDKLEKPKGNQNQNQRAVVLKKKKMMMIMRRRRRRSRRMTRMRRCFPLLRSKALQANIPQGLPSFKFVNLLVRHKLRRGANPWQDVYKTWTTQI